MDIVPDMVCPSCRAVIPASANFCMQCGKNIKKTSPSTTIARQIFIYSVSFFLAPFGLGYAFIYLKQPDTKSRTIGIISLVLTVCAIVLVITLAQIFMKSLYGSLDTLIY
ncbi:MAG: zinc ribbon domain-containing protein [Candidatus Azambacteria bacterium]|nr:zinc ribbon domain-containing protein [Candidatus Azambacteria bacterium]